MAANRSDIGFDNAQSHLHRSRPPRLLHQFAIVVLRDPPALIQVKPEHDDIEGVLLGVLTLALSMGS